MSEGEIVEGEIVDDDDDAAETDPTPDADIVDADVVDEDVVDPHPLGESGVGDPAVIALLRDTTDETTRPARSIAADHASDAPAGTVVDTPTPAEAPADDDIAGLSFPRLSARTQRFTLGEPRNVVVSGDGTRVVFLRSRSGTDPINCLWVVDATTGHEHLAADPRQLDAEAGQLPPEERARRERVRESAGGITAFAIDTDATLAAFALGGRLFVSDLEAGDATELPVAGPVFDPRPDPTGTRVAYVSGAALCVASLDGTWRAVAGGHGDEPSATVSWGRAEFIAAEEMHRFRGFWWSPDGTTLAATRVDTAPVGRVHIADPSDPARPATEHAYPSAGTPNADVSLHLINLASGRRHRRGVGPRALPVPHRGALVDPWAAHRHADPRPTHGGGVGGRHHDGRHHATLGRQRRRLGRARARCAVLRTGRRAVDVHRLRRRPAPRRRRCSGHAGRSPGARRGGGRRRRHRVPRQPARRRHGAARLARDDPAVRSRRSPTSPACTRRPPAVRRS